MKYKEAYKTIMDKNRSVAGRSELRQRQSLNRERRRELIPADVVHAILGGENAIRVWREYRGLSQQEAVKIAEVSVPYFSQLETSKRKGSLFYCSCPQRPDTKRYQIFHHVPASILPKHTPFMLACIRPRVSPAPSPRACRLRILVWKVSSTTSRLE